ncbi:LysR substrate-binding domain-containing protein [Variovorax sp. KK3]|uniref:LysR substrate-binding domain-containing protein n=1 Tax=Variovorax sp. KK3 TaxID=1855728 RepID=UPI00097BC762|nr:LysR substrate-binding domain-containing protein [Variovorax sp. KK3]
MELRQLRYFIGASEAGSLLKASAKLHVAQPALSHQIAALESEIGTQLFDRSSRGITLTEAGKVFLDHARVVLADLERARTAVQDYGSVPRGEVAIGFTTTVALTATMPVLAACRAQLPEVRLKIVEAYSGFLREWLQSGRLDLALMYGDEPEPGLAKRALLDDRLVLVSGAASGKMPKKLALTALAGRPLLIPGRDHGLRRIIDEACAPLNLQLNVVAEIESLGIVKRVVEAGIGETILPLGAVAEEVAAGRLRTAVIDSPAMLRRVVCSTNATRPDSLAKAAVGALLQDVLRQMVALGAWPARWVGPPASRPGRRGN